MAEQSRYGIGLRSIGWPRNRMLNRSHDVKDIYVIESVEEEVGIGMEVGKNKQMTRITGV